VTDVRLCSLSALDLRAGFRARDFTPVEALDALAARIGEREPQVNAFITPALEAARAEARQAEREYMRGEARPLAGIPVAVKDIFDTAGLRTTYGASIFSDHVPGSDATAVRRVREVGGIVLGKTLTHEFAWGITSENPHYGPCRNPHALDRVAGGSSGGSAAVVAYGGAPLALGSDTGGSIRIPAAFCGVVGLKPTWGGVSATGVFPLAPSLDHIGPLARTPADAELLLEVIQGPDPADPATAFRPAIVPEARAPGELRVGVCRDLLPVDLDPGVHRAFDAALAALADIGAGRVELRLPAAAAGIAAYSPLQMAEALRVHRLAGIFPARADEYGADVRERFERAQEVGLDDYLAADEARRRLRAGFAALFEQADVVLTPVAACPPIQIGERSVAHLGRATTFRELVLPYTVPQDVAGLPSCALPAGVDDLGLPVGVQLTGPWWSERRVLAAAGALSAALR
jgi:aspartyl-tRNA(Asn)/glutamyl-tRNA(Gln) amidotransferase subunit A